MREILFRAKNGNNAEWVYGHYVHQYGADMIYLPDGTDREYGFDYYHIIPDTVGQYTGLTDKNGKKIFEGDIWIDTDDDYVVYVVEFKNAQFCFTCYGWKGMLMEYGYDEYAGGWGEVDCLPMTDYNIDTIEIVGNIHDNPELLKGE